MGAESHLPQPDRDAEPSTFIQITNKLSYVAVVIVLLLKNLILNIKNCLISFFYVFVRVGRMKHPEKNFKDINEFINLIATDEDDETPDILSDEEVKKIVTGSHNKFSSGSIETDDGSLLGGHMEDYIKSEGNTPTKLADPVRLAQSQGDLLGEDEELEEVGVEEGQLI